MAGTPTRKKSYEELKERHGNTLTITRGFSLSDMKDKGLDKCLREVSNEITELLSYESSIHKIRLDVDSTGFTFEIVGKEDSFIKPKEESNNE